MNSAIEQMLKSYHVENIYDRKNAMKEIMQEIVLCGLSRAGFFKKAVEGQEGKVIRERPFPVQKPQHVAKCMVRGLEHKRKFVNPSKLFTFAQFLFAICPPIKWVYLKLEKNKLDRFEAQKASK